MIISHLFHYLQFILLVGSSKLARTRMVLAAPLYWVKMTQACRKNKTPTPNHSVMALLLNWHLPLPPVRLALRAVNREMLFQQCGGQWRNGGLCDFSKEVAKKINKSTMQLVTLNKYSTHLIRVKAHSFRALPKSEVTPFSGLGPILVLQDEQWSRIMSLRD